MVDYNEAQKQLIAQFDEIYKRITSPEAIAQLEQARVSIVPLKNGKLVADLQMLLALNGYTEHRAQPGSLSNSPLGATLDFLNLDDSDIPGNFGDDTRRDVSAFKRGALGGGGGGVYLNGQPLGNGPTVTKETVEMLIDGALKEMTKKAGMPIHAGIRALPSFQAEHPDLVAANPDLAASPEKIDDAKVIEAKDLPNTPITFGIPKADLQKYNKAQYIKMFKDLLSNRDFEKVNAALNDNRVDAAKDPLPKTVAMLLIKSGIILEGYDAAGLKKGLQEFGNRNSRDGIRNDGLLNTELLYELLNQAMQVDGIKEGIFKIAKGEYRDGGWGGSFVLLDQPVTASPQPETAPKSRIQATGGAEVGSEKPQAQPGTKPAQSARIRATGGAQLSEEPNARSDRTEPATQRRGGRRSATPAGRTSDGTLTLHAGYGSANGDEDVKEMQRQFNALGVYDLGPYGTNGDGVDGKWGPYTDAALKNFQLTHGIKKGDPNYGKFDDVTKKLLAEEAAKKGYNKSAEQSSEVAQRTDTPVTSPADVAALERRKVELLAQQEANKQVLAAANQVGVTPQVSQVNSSTADLLFSKADEDGKNGLSKEELAKFLEKNQHLKGVLALELPSTTSIVPPPATPNSNQTAAERQP